MYLNYLDFEKPVVELDAKIEELRHMGNDSNINILDEIEGLDVKPNELLKKIFADLNTWEIVQLARHPLRPHAIDYIEQIFTEFDELHGDRMFGDDGAIGVGDHVMMLQYSIYSVISPEGCASILWRSPEHAADTAASMKLTAQHALKNKLINEIIKEPSGGAHRDLPETAQKLKRALLSNLKQLQSESTQKLLQNRYERLMFTDIGYKVTKSARAKV